MKLIRSLFFGCIAVLAASFFASGHAVANDYDPAIYAGPSIELALHVPDIFALPAAIPGEVDVANNTVDAHAGIYVIQNQPLSTFRLSVDAWVHIDPHISAA
ncbi:hypothetical protein Brsp07_03667 [Brucella sp. NBRC 14130]